MTHWLSDATLAHLRGLGGVPDLAATRYTLVSVLGQGGMGTVYLAEDRELGRHVALKVLHPELGARLGPRRFQREIETAANLSHPHILPLHDSGGLH